MSVTPGPTPAAEARKIWRLYVARSSCIYDTTLSTCMRRKPSTPCHIRRESMQAGVDWALLSRGSHPAYHVLNQMTRSKSRLPRVHAL